LTALSQGDAATALKAGPTPESTTFLTDAILAKQQALAKITDIQVADHAEFAVEGNENAPETGPNVRGHYVVQVWYKFGGEDVYSVVDVVKIDGRWQLPEVANHFSSDLAGDGVTLFGLPLTGERVYVFPGPLDFEVPDPKDTLKQDTDNFCKTLQGSFNVINEVVPAGQ